MSDILYLKIVASIKQDIIRGNFRPGDRIESETELMKKFSTTKMTIRKSLSLLCNEGFIYSIPGKGYFVQKPRTNNYTFVFNKFDRLNVQIDEVKLLSVKIINDKPSIYIHLQLNEEECAIEVRRLLLSAKKAVAYEAVYMKQIPKNPIVEHIINFANYTEKIELNSFSLQKQLKIEATLPDTQLMQMLSLSANDIVYHVEETVRNTHENSVFSYSKYYTATKYLSLIATQEFGDSQEKHSIN